MANYITNYSHKLVAQDTQTLHACMHTNVGCLGTAINWRAMMSAVPEIMVGHQTIIQSLSMF